MKVTERLAYDASLFFISKFLRTSMNIKSILLTMLLCLTLSVTNAQELRLFKECLEPADQQLAEQLTKTSAIDNEFLQTIEELKQRAYSETTTKEDKINLAAFLLHKIILGYRNETYENLEPTLKAIDDLVPGNFYLESIWGDLHYYYGDFENAVTHYEYALNVKSDDIDLIGKFGVAQVNLQKFEVALEYILTYLEKYPTFFYGLYAAGKCEFELKDYESAIEHWEAAKENTKDEKNIKALEELIRQAKEFMASTDDSLTEEDQKFIITFAGNSREDLGDITFDILNEVYYDVTNLVGVNPDVKINVIFFLTDDYYKQGQDWSAGGAQGLQILIPLKSGYKSEEYVKGLLAHEFTHTMINLKTNNRAPLWVHEGLAQYQEYTTSYGAPDVLRPDFENCLQNDFVENELYIPLDQVPSYIGGSDRSNVIRGYVASYMAMRCMADFYGEQSFDTLLSAIGRGKNIHEAVEEATGKDYSDFEDEVKEYIKNQ